jgi:transposase
MADVARELGVDYDSLYRWVSTARGRVPARDQGNETKDQELARLRRENKRLETELEFAKKAAAFFAKQPR